MVLCSTVQLTFKRVLQFFIVLKTEALYYYIKELILRSTYMPLGKLEKKDRNQIPRVLLKGKDQGFLESMFIT